MGWKLGTYMLTMYWGSIFKSKRHNPPIQWKKGLSKKIFDWVKHHLGKNMNGAPKT